MSDEVEIKGEEYPTDESPWTRHNYAPCKIKHQFVIDVIEGEVPGTNIKRHIYVWKRTQKNESTNIIKLIRVVNVAKGNNFSDDDIIFMAFKNRLEDEDDKRLRN